MTDPAELLLGLAAVAAVLSAGIAAAVRHLSKRDGSAIAAGGLALPSLFLLLLAYWLVTMQVDDPPPGPVMFGTLLVAGVTAPVTFLASYLTVIGLRRRQRRTDQPRSLPPEK